MKITGSQRRLLAVIADAGPEGINSISKVIAKAAGGKPSKAVGHLKAMHLVENLNPTRVRATEAGLAALSGRRLEHEERPADALPELTDELLGRLEGVDRATVNELQRRMHRTYREVRPVLQRLEEMGHLTVEHEPNPLCSVVRPARATA